jgi:AcrR family transcriptional regulator
MNEQPTKNADKKQHCILDAAQHRFACYGFAKTSMEEIASDIGLSKASLYYYFAAKEDLFLAVIAREQKEFIEQMEKMVGKCDSSKSKLQEYILNQLMLLKKLDNLRILNQQAARELHPILHDVFKAFALEEVRIMQTIVNEGIERAEFFADSAEKTALLLVHILQGLRLKYIKINPLHSPDTQARYTAITAEFKLLAQLLCTGLQAGPECAPHKE